MSAIHRMTKAVAKHEDRLGSVVFSAEDNESLHQSLNGDFILYRVLVDQILDGKYQLTSNKASLQDYFHPDDKKEKSLLDEFDKKYESKDAIFWYTRESPVYKNLNKALRTQNTDDIAPFATFICDLNKQLADEHRKFVAEQKSPLLNVYRGQLISKDEIVRLKSSPGQLISMNSFLSTSTNRKKAFEFATSRPPPSDDLARVLLELHIDIKALSRPYADIKRFSAFPDEEEILFVVGCVFRIDQIEFDEQNELWTAELTLCSEQNADVKKLTDVIEKELDGQNPLVALANYLLDMNKYDQAQIYLQTLLKNKAIEKPADLALCSIILGKSEQKKGNYNSSRDHFNTALDYLTKTSKPLDHPLISECYNHIASVFYSESRYEQAFDYYEKALNTPRNVSSTTYFGLAQIHHQSQLYHLALDYLEKILHDESQLTYAILSNVYIHMGMNYSAMNKDEQAREMFDKVVEFQTKTLNETHPDLSYTYHAMASMHLERDQFDKTWEYLNKAHDLQTQTLPNDHPDFAETYQNYALFFVKTNQLNEALFSYEQRLDNQLKTLAWNHPNVMKTYSDIGKIHWQLKDYDRASEYFEEILRAEVERRKSGETSLNVSYKTLGDLYYDKYEMFTDDDDLDRALPFYLQFLQNELQSKLIEDFALVDIYQTLASIYSHKRQLKQALFYYHHLLDCHQRKLPFDQLQIDHIYRSIKKVYLKRSDFNQKLFEYAHTNDKNNSAKRIEKIHFEQRHLDQAFAYYHNILDNKQTSTSFNDLCYVLGNISYEKRNYEQALTYFSQMLVKEIQHRPLQHVSFEKLYQAMANVLSKQHEINRALIYFYRLLDCLYQQRGRREAIKQTYVRIGKILRENNLVIDHRRRKTIVQLDQRLINVFLEGYCLHQLAAYFEDLAEKRTRKFSFTDISMIQTKIYLKKQDFPRALFHLHQLLEHQMRKYPLGHVSLVWTYLTFADLYDQQGHSKNAIQSYQYALHVAQRFDGHNQLFIERIEDRLRRVLIPRL